MPRISGGRVGFQAIKVAECLDGACRRVFPFPYLSRFPGKYASCRDPSGPRINVFACRLYDFMIGIIDAYEVSLIPQVFLVILNLLQRSR